jgi:hypothetical protein
MSFSLQTKKVSGALGAALGGNAELRELSYGQLREAMTKAPTIAEAAEYITAASLIVNGQPLGIEALRALPGRFSGEIGSLLAEVVAMHGMGEQAGKA